MHDIDFKIYNYNLFKEKREKNISFRWSQANQSFEFVKWVKDQRVSNGEYCYVIAFLTLDDRYDPSIREVNTRILDLSSEEFDSYSRLGLKIWDTYKDVRSNKLKEYRNYLKSLIKTSKEINDREE